MALIRRAGLAFVLMSVAKIFSYALQITLTHLNTTRVYGQYAYAISIVTTLAAFASLGFNNSVLRFVPEYLKLRKYSELHGFLNIARITTLLGGSLVGLICFTILILLQNKFNWSSAGLFGITVLAMTLVQYYSELARSVGSVTASLAPGLMQPLLTMTVMLMFYVSSRTGNITVVGVSIATSYVITVGVFAVINLRRKVEWKHYKPVYRIKTWMSVSNNMLFMVSFQTIVTQADVITVGSVLGQAETGFYSIGAKVAALASFILVAVNQVFAPNISALYSAGNPGRLQQELSKAAMLTFLPTFVIGLVLYYCAPAFLHVFGPDFIRATGVARVLILGQIINAASGPVGYVLNLTGHHRVTTKIYFITAVANVVGCYIAARLGGTVDAVAWVSMVSMILWNVWMHVSVVRRLGVWPSVIGVFNLKKHAKATS